MRKISFVTAIFFLLLVLPTAVVLAENGGSSNSQEDISKTQNEKGVEFEQEKIEARSKIASRSALHNEKLEATKQNVCETHQKNLVNRSQSLINRAQTQINNFNQIATRVDTFYTQRLVPKGINVASYSALKADITTKQNAVNVVLAVAKDDATNFSCTSNDPKGQLANFRADMQAVISALKDFRTSVKNFIVAVHTAFNNANPEATSSGQKND